MDQASGLVACRDVVIRVASRVTEFVDIIQFGQLSGPGFGLHYGRTGDARDRIGGRDASNPPARPR